MVRPCHADRPPVTPCQSAERLVRFRPGAVSVVSATMSRPIRWRSHRWPPDASFNVANWYTAQRTRQRHNCAGQWLDRGCGPTTKLPAGDSSAGTSATDRRLRRSWWFRAARSRGEPPAVSVATFEHIGSSPLIDPVCRVIIRTARPTAIPLRQPSRRSR